MAVTTPEMCRVTLVTPNRWADLALPAAEPLAELLPAVLDHVGDDALSGHPVGLQRLGSPPLDVDRSLAGNGVLDGETLYLGVADQLMPTLDFDDAIAGLGAGVTGLANRWRPRDSRRLLVASAAVPALGALAVLVTPSIAAWTRPGAPAGLIAVAAVAGATALLGLIGAAAASRAWADRTLALILGGAAVPFAAVSAGAVATVVTGAAPVSAATCLAAAAAVLAVSVLADGAVGRVSAGFAAPAFAGLIAGLGALVSLVSDWPARNGLALVLVLSVLSGEVVVPLACRLSGVVLPPLPRTSEELEEGIEPVPAQDTLTRAVQVDEYVTAILAGAAVLVVVCAAVLSRDPSTWTRALVLTASLSALLRFRVFGGRGQRAAWLAAGVAGPATMLVGAGLVGGPDVRPWIAVVLLALAVALLAGAVVLPGRRTLPHVGRAAEIFEGLTAASLLPLLLAVLGTYSAARNFR